MHWADSVLQTMNYEEKIGQLFMAVTRSDKDENPEEIKNLICDQHIGGVMFLRGFPTRQTVLTNEFQHLSKIKLMISIDGEWGLQMRLDSTIRFPRQMTLGAMEDDTLIYDMGKEIGRQCRRMGIHVNFAPDIDINNNPMNPVINTRSFGEVREDVARKGLLYMNGMQANGIMACGKHFPGHGNTDTDSHLALPVINQPRAEIDSVELFPFKKLFDSGLSSVMVAHLHIPSLDTTRGQASTLSKSIVDTLLQQTMGFRGLIFTDALNMKGVSAYYSPGTLEVKALQAGNDMLLYSDDVKKGIEQIHYAIQNCELEQTDIDKKVKKILASKHWCGLNKYSQVKTERLVEDLNSHHAQWLNYRLYRDAVTMLANKKDILPLKNIKEKKIASLVINDTLYDPFQLYLSDYAPVADFRMTNDASPETVDSLIDVLKEFDYVIVSIHNTSTRASVNFNISPEDDRLLVALQKKTKVIFCLFGNAYCFTQLPDAMDSDAVIIAYEDTYLPHLVTAEIIFGAMGAHAFLPVTPVASIVRGSGIDFKDAHLRMKYVLPEEEEYSSSVLDKIDSIAVNAIREKIFPGCQVVVASNGSEIYRKSFGFHTYDSLLHVSDYDLYDIASVTKIAATALATMKLFEEDKISLDKKISKYLPEFKNSNKEDITLREMLAHQSGLQAWIPFYKHTLANGGPSYEVYHPVKDVNYSIPVADSLFIRNDYHEKIWKEIIDSPMGQKGKYVYSDLGMLIMQKIIEKITGKPLDEYTDENFYKPLGLHRLCFRPLEKFEKKNIIPTENDTVFRMQLVHGYVHDPAAAMLNGVAGNAGLFSNANSLAVIMQMILNDGEYGGIKLLKHETINLFTAQQYPGTKNRRGLIFDKPETDKSINGPTATDASVFSFGHQGFTGTCTWADPKNKMIFIFLSNRIHPDAGNNKISQKNIRTRMMQVVYDAKKKFEK